MIVVSSIEGDACRAWQLLMRFFFVQRGHLPSWGSAFGLSPVQCHVLHLLEPGRPLPMSRLADALSCDASNVTGLVDRLEAQGLVTRRPTPDDRRVKVLELTAQGVRRRAELLRRMTGRPLPLSRLTPREQRTLVALLDRLFDDPAD
jgi:MarR family transcriptional regulator, organic hydroperoxide resistance regulator